jgi:hypothetical protein
MTILFSYIHIYSRVIVIILSSIMIAIPKLGECRLVMSFVTLMLVMSISTGQMQLANAGGKSPYESGYDHGCDDADISDPDDRYINQPEKGPSFHTDQFMAGYSEGVDDCSDGDNGSGTSEDEGPDDSRRWLSRISDWQ